MKETTVYTNIKGISEILDCSRSTSCRLVKIVKEHPERYGQYAVAGNRYFVPAVVDAQTYKEAFSEGLDEFVPEYDPGTIVEMLRAAS